MDRRTADAIDLIEQAWAERRRAIEWAPDSESELQRILEEVRDKLVAAVEICRKVGAQRELVHPLRKLGHVEQDLGHEEKTQDLYEEAVAVSRRVGDAFLVAHSVRHLGDIRRSAGQLHAAEECYTEALALYRNHAQPPALDFANALMRMAIVKEEAGMVPEAKKLWREARDLCGESGVDEGVAECSRRVESL